MDTDVIVIGAGIAGLTAARELSRAGRRVIVLERSLGVGGRCATRRVEGQPVDHGLAFLHGSDPAFLNLVREAGPGRIEWPVRVRGTGTPCQPRAYGSREHRLAFEPGLTAFPKLLARGQEIRLGTRVLACRPVAGGVRVETEGQGSLAAGDVILAMAAEQAAALLPEAAPDSPDLQAARFLLDTVGSFPCLTVLAGYPRREAVPEWDIWYPEESPILQLVSHDSAKRRNPAATVLVHQALPRWSRSHMEEEPESWTRGILEEARRLLGGWALNPVWVQSHRWRYARTDDAGALGRPLVLFFPGGGRIGLAGDIFSSRYAGAEGAWESGRELALRMAAEERK